MSNIGRTFSFSSKPYLQIITYLFEAIRLICKLYIGDLQLLHISNHAACMQDHLQMKLQFQVIRMCPIYIYMHRSNFLLPAQKTKSHLRFGHSFRFQNICLVLNSFPRSNYVQSKIIFLFFFVKTIGYNSMLLLR